MTVTVDDLRHALERQVPAMRIAVTLRTEDAGELVLYATAAEQVASVVERVLRQKLAQLERIERETGPMRR